jgi:tetratricopeptide (TPR) repeat protein
MRKVVLTALGAAALTVMASGTAMAQSRPPSGACTRELARSQLENWNPDPYAQLSLAETCRSVSLSTRGIESARARFYAGRAYNRANRPEDAVSQLEIAVNAAKDFEGDRFAREMRAGRLELAEAYRMTNRVDSARNLLNNTALSPSDPGLAYQKAMLTLAELGSGGELNAFQTLAPFFQQDDKILLGTPQNPTYMTAEEVRRGRSWLYRLGLSLGKAALKPGGDSVQQRNDAITALGFLVPAAGAVNAACPDPQPVDCATAIAGTASINSLAAQLAPSREELLNVFFQIGIAHLKAGGLQASPGLASLGDANMGGLGALDCMSGQLAVDAPRHFQDAATAFNTYVTRSSASAASADSARWGLGCTILANMAFVPSFERPRYIALAIDQLSKTPKQPLTLLTLARAQVLQGRPDLARDSFKQALDLSPTTNRCPANTSRFPESNKDVLASQLYVEMARTRFAQAVTADPAYGMSEGAGNDLHYRVITEIANARPAVLRESEPDLRCAVFLNHENTEARLMLGHIYLRLGTQEDGGPALDRAPFPKAETALEYFERRRATTVPGAAEGYYLLSMRKTLARYGVLLASRESKNEPETISRKFRNEGALAVRLATQAYSLSQRPEYRRQVCDAQIMFGETADENFCMAVGEDRARAEALLYEGMYWLRRGQRDRNMNERKVSWSQSIRAFNRGTAEKQGEQIITSTVGAKQVSLDLGALLAYGHRYVLKCNQLNAEDFDTAPPEVKEFYRLSGIPLTCGGPPR